MAKTYEYTARDVSGQLITGNIIAENEDAVAAFICHKGYYVTGIREKKRSVFLSMFQDFRQITLRELSILCRQFATMFAAGVPLISCLKVLIEQTYHYKLKEALKEILIKVQEGEQLSAAMSCYPELFPEMMISAIEAGEIGGIMDSVLKRLALQFEKEYKLNEKIKTAATYPLAVMLIAFASFLFILIFVLPTFLTLYEGMNLEVPLPTRILLTISSFITGHLLLLLGLTLLVVYTSIMSFKNPRGRRFLDSILLKIPVLGLLLRKTAIVRFSRTFAALIKGGVPIVGALQVAKKTTGNLYMTAALTVVQENLQAGANLSRPLKALKIFPPMVVQMIAIGEETGELDQMLEKIAEFYDNEVEDTIARFSSMLEPLFICLLGVIVGSLIIAVILPLFEVITNIQQEI